ncbi:MAG: glycogen/starch synthase, partial [Planctomycetota bacterium]
MRVLMLGWEFPPFISGGLGTACYGLTRAMDALGHDIRFVLPRAVHGETASHVKLIAPDAPPASAASAPGRTGAASPGLTAPDGSTIGPARSPADGSPTAQQPGPPAQGDSPLDFNLPGFDHTKFTGLPSDIVAPYPEPTDEQGQPLPAQERPSFDDLPAETRAKLVQHAAALRAAGVAVPDEWFEAQAGMSGEGGGGGGPSAGQDYAGDVMTTAQNYAQMALRLCGKEDFDVIHAHDWMTYPAGIALAQAAGTPLVAHLHSTEVDRSGVPGHERGAVRGRRG